MTPRVSVLIACYNAERYVGETLESVFGQTWPNLEVIVVDDGSRDASVEVIAAFARPNLKLIRQENRGQGAALNVAIEAMSGDFVQFIDADDLIDPDKIERQMARLMEAPDRIASAEWGRFYGDPAETRFVPEPVWRDLDPLDWLAESRRTGLDMMFPALWLIPAEIVRAAGPWDETLSLSNDTEFFTRAVLASQGVLFAEGARCRYRSGLPGSASGQKSAAHWASHLRVVELCEAHVRTREDSERIRRGFAISLQHLAHGAYPYAPEIAETALARARALDPVTIRPGGGPAFKLLSRLVGWRAARRLQVASGRK